MPDKAASAPYVERRFGVRCRIDGVPITRHYRWLTLWSWPLTTTATICVRSWRIEWHPRSRPRLARPNVHVYRDA